MDGASQGAARLGRGQGDGLKPVNLVIINPNSTQAMTDAIERAARAAAPGIEIEGWTSHRGPAAIEGPKDGAAATPHLLDLVEKAVRGGARGIGIGCFDDTALPLAAQRAPCPVIGIGQAAFHYCAIRRWRFGVVTTLAVSVPVIEANIRSYGLWDFCTGVRAAGVPVLDLDQAPEKCADAVLDQALCSVGQDGAQAVVLGCAGMVNVTATLRAALAVPVIDPVEAGATALHWASALSRLR